MKSLLLTIGFIIITNLSIAQEEIGYDCNYEIKFDVAQFSDKEPKSIVRNFVDFLFESKDQKFNIQTRYSVTGVIYISSNTSIARTDIEGFFKQEDSCITSFEQVPHEEDANETSGNIAEN